jgi:hypothetical protein
MLLLPVKLAVGLYLADIPPFSFSKLFHETVVILSFSGFLF